MSFILNFLHLSDMNQARWGPDMWIGNLAANTQRHSTILIKVEMWPSLAVDAEKTKSFMLKICQKINAFAMLLVMPVHIKHFNHLKYNPTHSVFSRQRWLPW